MNAVSFLQIFYGSVLSQAVNMSRNISRNELKLTTRSSGSQIKSQHFSVTCKSGCYVPKGVISISLPPGVAYQLTLALLTSALHACPPLLYQAPPHSSPSPQRFSSFSRSALSSPAILSLRQPWSCSICLSVCVLDSSRCLGIFSFFCLQYNPSLTPYYGTAVLVNFLPHPQHTPSH